MPQPQNQKQLKDLNLKDLSSLDIKELQNLDYFNLAQDLVKKPDLLISIAAILASIIFSYNIFTSTGNNQKNLKNEIGQLEIKAKNLDNLNNAQINLQNFLKSSPKTIPENEFIDKITDLAAKRFIQINSFSPNKNQNDPLFDSNFISINAAAKTYSSLWLFVHDIENSGYTIRINRWEASLGEKRDFRRRNRSQKSTEETVITFHIDIACITFKQ